MEAETNNSQVKWGPVAAVIGTVVIFFVAQVLGLMIYVAGLAIIRGISFDSALNSLSNDLSPVQQFLSVLLIEATTLIMLRWFLQRRKSNFRDLGLKGRFRLSDFSRAVAGYAMYFVCYLLLIQGISLLIPSLDLDQEQQLGFSTTLSSWQLIPAFLSLVVLPPLVEEILCRGFLYTGLRTKLKPIMATVITSLVFAAAHLQWGSGTALLWVAAIDTFILSVVLCRLREKTGRLWAPIGLHALKNLIAFAALFIFKVG